MAASVWVHTLSVFVFLVLWAWIDDDTDAEYRLEMRSRVVMGLRRNDGECKGQITENKREFRRAPGKEVMPIQGLQGKSLSRRGLPNARQANANTMERDLGHSAMFVQ